MVAAAAMECGYVCAYMCARMPSVSASKEVGCVVWCGWVDKDIKAHRQGKRHTYSCLNVAGLAEWSLKQSPPESRSTSKDMRCDVGSRDQLHRVPGASKRPCLVLSPTNIACWVSCTPGSSVLRAGEKSRGSVGARKAAQPGRKLRACERAACAAQPAAVDCDRHGPRSAGLLVTLGKAPLSARYKLIPPPPKTVGAPYSSAQMLPSSS